jgi:N-acetylneuraminic acid mutarotase
VHYCDRTCQAGGWKAHKKVCGIWTCLTNIPSAAGGGRFVLAAGCYKNDIIMVCGQDPGRNCECWSYNLDSEQWSKRNKLPFSGRSACDGLVVQNFMYVVRYTSSTAQLLRLDLENKDSKWEALASLEGFRMDTSITSDGESYIYISGGVVLANPMNPMSEHVPLSSVARYDIAKNKWEGNWAKMPTPRFSHSTIVANDKLYIFGG